MFSNSRSFLLFLIVLSSMIKSIFAFHHPMKYSLSVLRNRHLYKNNRNVDMTARSRYIYLSMGPTDGTPEFLAYLAAAAAAIPMSIPIDAALQNGYKRIESISNTRINDEEGTVFAYIARPTTTEIRPMVVLIHQFFGLTRRDTELCDELARRGYVAVAPDCFQGNTTGIIPRAISFVTEAAYNDNWEINNKDMRRVVSFMEREGKNTYGVDTSRIVVAGFCFGGGLALRYAQTFPESVRGVGIFYGKPIKSLLQLQCDVYGVFGDKDRQFPPKMVDEFELLLTSNGIKNEIRRYPDKAHAFVDDLACINKGGDAGDAWTGFIQFLEQKLGSYAA